MDILLFLNSTRCEWKFEKIEDSITISKPNQYSIWNVRYNLPLYAASELFNREYCKRNIFLWYKPKVDSNKFKWIVDCKGGDYQWI